MELEYTPINKIEINDWDEFVQKVYGKKYDFQQQDGCKSRGTYEFSVPPTCIYDYEDDEIPVEVNGDEMGVSFKAWLERTKPFFRGYQDDLFWGRNFYPSVDMIIDDLYKKGLIKEGKYFINIDW